MGREGKKGAADILNLLATAWIKNKPACMTGKNSFNLTEIVKLMKNTLDGLNSVPVRLPVKSSRVPSSCNENKELS